MMTEAAFCGNCGTRLDPQGRFCTSCGTDQRDFEQPTDSPHADAAAHRNSTAAHATGTEDPHAGGRGGQRPDRVQERLSGFEPGAGELAGQLAAGVQTPGVAAAALASLIAAGATVAVALLLTITLPDQSLIGLIGVDHGLLTETFGHVMQFLQVELGTVEGFPQGYEAAPTTLLLIPLGACALGAATQGFRTSGMDSRARIAWGAGTGAPFAFLMLACGLSAGDLEPSVGSAFGTALGTGVLGGALGALVQLRRERVSVLLPRPLNAMLEVVGAALRPLAVAFVCLAIIVTTGWIVQVLRLDVEFGGERSAAVAIVDSVLHVGDHGLHGIALGAGADFESSGGLPLPVAAPEGVFEAVTESASDGSAESGDGTFKLFDYSTDIAPYVFIPLTITLIAVPSLLALYAGFAVARTRRAATPGLGAAWGAVVGPLWAIMLALVTAISAGEPAFTGHPDGDSLFGLSLLGGAALGALGGLLAAQARGPTEQAQADPPTSTSTATVDSPETSTPPAPRSDIR